MPPFKLTSSREMKDKPLGRKASKFDRVIFKVNFLNPKLSLGNRLMEILITCILKERFLWVNISSDFESNKEFSEVLYIQLILIKSCEEVAGNLEENTSLISWAKSDNFLLPTKTWINVAIHENICLKVL